MTLRIDRFLADTTHTIDAFLFGSTANLPTFDIKGGHLCWPKVPRMSDRSPFGLRNFRQSLSTAHRVHALTHAERIGVSRS
jgi:hypothetical protein